MAKVCEGCKISEKHKYWNDFPAMKQRFFKILLGDFEHQLRVPRKFVECFKGKLSKQCSLIGPSGNKWRVRVEETREDVVFSSGWDRFVSDHDLKVADFLVFSYAGCSSFEVMVFDGTGCEREGSHFAKNQSLLAQATCSSTLHANKNGGMLASDQETDISMEEVRLDEQESEASSQRKRRAANKGKGKKNEKCKSEGKKKKAPSLEECDIPEDEEEEEEDSFYGQNEEGAFHWRLKERRGGSSQGKQSKMFYISNRGTPTQLEKLRAHSMALSHISKSKSTGAPMFEITMLPTHVYNGFHLTIPKEWALEHMFHEAHEVELQVPALKRSWIVGCRWTPSQCQIRAKWPRFVLENNLEDHDVCVFELIHKGESGGGRKAVFKVHIFRAVADIVPLTVKRGVV